jgi:PST family polysaccharide transporter
LSLINPFDYFQRHAYIRKIIANSSWLVAYQIIRLSLSMLVGVWVARYLGPEALGTLQYSITFVLLFSPLIIFGMRPLLMRRYVLRKEQADELSGSAVMITSSTFLVVLFLFILPVNYYLHYGELKFELILIVSVLLFFDFSKVLECWFDSQVASKFIVLARLASLVVSSVIRIGLILSAASLVMFAWVVTIEAVLFSLILLVIYARRVASPFNWRIKTATIGELIAFSWPLVLSSVSTTVYLKIDKIMLSQLDSDSATGLYSAATMLSESYYFIGNALINSVTAGLISLHKKNTPAYYQRFSQILTLFVMAVVLVAVPVSLFSQQIVVLIFGREYLGAAPVLAIHVWAGLFVFFVLIEKNWFVNEGWTRMILYRTTAGAVINILLNLLLIPTYGVTGAAVATVISYSFICFFGNLFNRRTFFMFRLECQALYLKPLFDKLIRS